MADSKKYDGSQWEHSLRKMTTATAEIEPTIYTDGTPITSYTIKGNTVQNGTPTPSNPVPVVGVGELETTGEHTGEYKIPILSGGVTTNIYLGSTQTTRQIKKLVFDGTEDWQKSGSASNGFYMFPPNLRTLSNAYCNIAIQTKNTQEYYTTPWTMLISNTVAINTDSAVIGGTTKEDWKAYLAQQYANGTPVTIWYVLATAETAAVNEPLMKIGDYADTLSNATAIPTTEGANSITVDTTVQPSEFSATWSGWHDSSVKEYDGSDWQ